MQLILSKDATKQLLRLPQSEQVKIKKKLIQLRENPFGGKKLEGELSSDRALRAWPYRIIYSINKKEKRVEVSTIQHRQGAYK